MCEVFFSDVVRNGEGWTKNFKSSPAEEDDVKGDDVEMTGGGIERVFSSVGKQHDDLKKQTRDKTLENTLKESINTKLSTCDDRAVFTDDDDTYRNHK